MGNSVSTMRHDETTVTVAGVPVRCYRAGAGAGPSLILVHGAGPGSAQAAWAPLWPALTPHARLLAPDLPGHGASPLGATPRTVEGYGAWLLGFLDACGIGRAALAGRSLGAAIALRAALDAPARVERLALLAAPEATDHQLAAVACPLLVRSGASERVTGELVAFLARGAAGGR